MSEKIPQEVNPNDLMRQMDHALQYGTIEDLQSLFNGGMSIDQTDFEGRTALQVMSFQGNKAAVEMLISRGANVNAIFMYHDRIPMTALDAAQEARKTEIVAVLLAHGGKMGKELRPES